MKDIFNVLLDPGDSCDADIKKLLKATSARFAILLNIEVDINNLMRGNKSSSSKGS